MTSDELKAYIDSLNRGYIASDKRDELDKAQEQADRITAAYREWQAREDWRHINGDLDI